MALAPGQVPVTREQVSLWLKNWPVVQEANPDLTMRDYIYGQVQGLNLPDANVDTSAMDEWTDQTHLADMILADLPSYGYTDSV